jgi:tape measure domain-containing protein
MEGGDQLMATVDDRVVQLEFDNKQFKNATAETMSTLEKLKQSLDFSASRKGVDDLGSSFNNMKLGPLATTIEGVNGKFLAMATIGITALSNIASQAIQTGAILVKSLTIDPIKQGFAEYETNLNSVQTILSNTAASGAGLKEVNAALGELNEYSDKTIYNFSEMARNIGTFTAAGVDLDSSTAAIKGIANLAALSGSNSQQASTAMYQLSQALAAGKVSLMDWNSVVNAGMGGTVFQRALAQTAEKMGKLKDGAVSLTGPMKNVSIAGMSFRESISDPKVGGWLTSDVLTKTLAQFTGDLSDAELAAQGFTKAEVMAIQKQAKMAQEAATNVKTLSQVIDVAKETAGSGWAQTWSIIFGDFSEAKGTFSELSNTINGFINNFSDARNELLQGWKDLGGRDLLIDGITRAFKTLGLILKPIARAFREIFPATTAEKLVGLTLEFRNFFKYLNISGETLDKVQRTFAGFFAIFSIGKSIISGIIGVVVDLVKSFGGVGSGLLDATAGIGDFLVKIDQAIKNGALIPFFQKLNAIMAPINVIIRKVGEGLQALFSGALFDGLQMATDGFDKVNERLSPLKGLTQTLISLWQRFTQMLSGLSEVFSEVLANVSEIFSQIPEMIQESVSNGNYSAMLDTINTAIFGGIFLLFRNFMKNGLPGASSGLIDSITGTFDQLTGTLKAMQTQIKADALKDIAIAVGILVASLFVLSLIPSAKLTKALAAMAATFTQLMLAMAVLDRISQSSGFLKLPIVAGSLILLSTALLVLSAAILVMSSMTWEELAKGLSAVTLILGVLDVTMKPLAANAPGMMAAATAILILSGAMVVLAGAMKIFASMSWEELGKGLATVAGALAVIAVTMSLMPGPSMLVTAAGVLVVATAMTVLAGAMKIFASMTWEEIGKGLAATAGSLLIIAGAMALMPGPSLILTAAGLAIVAVALNGIALALKSMGGMSWEEIAKGLVALAGSLLILAGGLYLMTGTLAGSAALLVASAALLMLAPALKILGGMSWEEIGKGLIALAGAFAVIGLAALLLTPVIPQIIGLAGAVALLGVGMALIGLGVLAFATAMSTLVAIGSMGVVALTAIMQTVIGIIPTVMKALELALVAFAEAIIAAAPALIEAIVVVLGGLLDAIVELTPKVVETLGVLLDAIIELCIEYIPKLVTAGMVVVTGLLDGISKKLPKMMDKAGDVIVAFIRGLGAQALKITTAAGETLITFVEGLTTWIRNNQQRMNDAGRELVKAIIDGMISGIASLGSGVIEAIAGLAGNAIDRAKEILGIASPSKVFKEIGKNVVLGFVNGVVGGREQIDRSLQVITDQIKKAREDAARDLAELKNKVKDLKDDPRTEANKKALAKAEADLKKAEAAKKALDKAYATVTKEHKEQIKQLKQLASEYDKTSEKLDEAKDKLKALTDERNNYAKSITDAYSKLPELNADTTLDTYFDNIRKATEANIKFKATLDQLRTLGLNDNQYKDFLAQGTDIQPFLDSLLASGGDTIAELNKIDVSLTNSASALGQGAADSLYKAGIDIAQGLVDGLESKLSEIADKMKSIGKLIADEIKKELGIKSPSRVFKEIGKFTMKGLALGIEKNTNVIDISARRAGQVAVESMKKSLQAISGAVSSDIEVQPTIAPVLDLTAFRKDAGKMTDILATDPLQASVSFQNAVATNNTVEDVKAAVEAYNAFQQTGTTVELTQINNSPKALSSAEIYRQTKNQLSIVKGALDN